MRRLALVCEDLEDVPREIPLDAESVWCAPDLNPEHMAVGFRFLSAAESDREALDRLVSDFGFVDSRADVPARDARGAALPTWHLQ